MIGNTKAWYKGNSGSTYEIASPSSLELSADVLSTETFTVNETDKLIYMMRVSPYYIGELEYYNTLQVGYSAYLLKFDISMTGLYCLSSRAINIRAYKRYRQDSRTHVPITSIIFDGTTTTQDYIDTLYFNGLDWCGIAFYFAGSTSMNNINFYYDDVSVTVTVYGIGKYTLP